MTTDDPPERDDVVALVRELRARARRDVEAALKLPGDQAVSWLLARSTAAPVLAS